MKSTNKFFLILLLLILAACTNESSEPVNEANTDMQVLMVNSELVQGANRFAVALLDETGSLIHDADVTLQYFDLSDADNPVAEESATATKVTSADGTVTLYTDSRSFDRPGAWGVAISAALPNGGRELQRVSFEVAADSTAVTPGEAVPIVETDTAVSANGDLSQITTADPPNPAFYELSLTDALGNGKPTLLYFATPAFCQTKVCGPGYDEFNQIYESVGSKYNMIHTEVFADLNDPAASGFPLIPAMEAFGLKTEPWLYVIDEDGTAIYRVEGLFSAAEMETVLAELRLSN